jgi:hypothetical protein
MKKLISMTDFVLDRNKSEEVCREDFVKCSRYANFLKQPLELWMFVPCDEKGNVLEHSIEPEYPYNDKTCDIWSQYDIYLKKYQQAKERVLFEGFEIKGDFLLLNNYTFAVTSDLKLYIEDFGCVEKLLYHYLGNDIELTPTAIKKIGLFIN